MHWIVPINAGAVRLAWHDDGTGYPELVVSDREIHKKIKNPESSLSLIVVA